MLLPYIRGQLIQSIRNVFFHAHVRKQRRRLKQVAHLALLRRQLDARFCIEQNIFAQRNSSFLRTHQARDAIQQRRLPSA
jgi:hypothetical protein